MLAQDTVKKFILDYLYPKIAEAKLQDETCLDLNLISSGLLDSLGFLQLVSKVEAKFKVEIDFSDEDPQEFTSLEGFIRCVVSSYSNPKEEE